MRSDGLYQILRGMIRDEIDQTPGFRELTSKSTLPCNEHAERTILGAALLDGKIPAEAKELLPEEFCLASHQRIWAEMSAMQAVDTVVLMEKMGADGCKEVGGHAYLASLTDGLPRQPVVGEYIGIVKEKARLRRIIAACQTAIQASQEQGTASAEIVEQLGVALKGIRRARK